MIGLSSAFAQNDPPSTHGMLVVGEKTIYLSHLPMFHSPHDYQVILEANIGDTKPIYLLNKRAYPEETVYTLVPEPFVLPQMIENLRPFRAKLFRGHFERGGVQIGNNTVVNITKVIYFKKFEKDIEHPKNLNYVFFGKNDELFLAHLITAKPDFDQILGTQIDPSSMANLLNGESHAIFEIPNSDNEKPLLDNATIEIKELTFENLKQYYLEFDDLSF